MNAIYESVIKAMADIEPIAKGRRNDKQGFSFRGIDDIMNELQPVLKKHGLFVVPKVVSVVRAEKQTNSGGALLYSIATMEYTMYAADGSFIVGSTIGEGMDSGDKASNKAMSVALKYFLLQTFCIPTEDMKDPDAESHEVVSEKKIQLEKQTVILEGYIASGIFPESEAKKAKLAIDQSNLENINGWIKYAKKQEAGR
jgi:hypothetical protein